MAQQIAVLPQTAQPTATQSVQPAATRKPTDQSFASKLQNAEQQNPQAESSQKAEQAEKAKKQSNPSKTDISTDNTAIALSAGSILKQFCLQAETIPFATNAEEPATVSVVESMQSASFQQTEQLSQTAPAWSTEQVVQAAPQVLSESLPQQFVKDAKQPETAMSGLNILAQAETLKAEFPVSAMQASASASATGNKEAQAQQVSRQTAPEQIQTPLAEGYTTAQTIVHEENPQQESSAGTATQMDSSKKPNQTGLGEKEGLSNVPYMSALPYDNSNVVIPISQEAVVSQTAPTQQLADQIAANMENGRKEFTMDLFPKDLGKVSVKLVSQNGCLTVEISAANPKTQSLLLSNAGEIKSILQMEQPVQVVDASQNKQWYDQHQAPNQQPQQQEQEQEQQQQKQQSFEGTLSTDDFLAVMQHLRTVAI